MKKMLILLAVVALAVPVMAQDTVNLNARVVVQQFAELDVIDNSMRLVLTEPGDGGVGGFNGDGDLAEVTLKSNYDTEIVVTSGSGLMDWNGSGTMFVKGTDVDDASKVIGIWPNICRAPYDGGEAFNWQGGTEIVMNNEVRPNGSSVIADGIQPTQGFNMVIGASSEFDRTPDGTWASPGDYFGTVVLTVQEYTP
jgi:hypothetical protein